MDFINTDPEEVNWEDLWHKNQIRIRVFVREYAEKIPVLPGHWPEFLINLTKYYEYCKITEIGVLGHTLDRVGEGNTKKRCGISFYFKSDVDRISFILKFK